MARPPSTSLSPSQRRIAQAVAERERNGFTAFVSDLVRELGYATRSSIAATLRVMERNGFLEFESTGQRGKAQLVRLTSKARHVLGVGGIPMVGTITGGPLKEAVAEPEQVFEPADLVPYQPGDFLLRVEGDSMTGDGIYSGDLVLIRPGVEVRSGEIAAVQVRPDYEATLKHLIFEPGQPEVLLRASNPRYPDMRVPARDVTVAGAFRWLIRHGR